GSLAAPPIALCEVQGDLYRAWLAAAKLLELLGDAPRARSLASRAAALRARFERDFWSERLGCYVLGLQQGGRPLEVVASNAGQVLWSGIASPERARCGAPADAERHVQRLGHPHALQSRAALQPAQLSAGERLAAR